MSVRFHWLLNLSAVYPSFLVMSVPPKSGFSDLKAIRRPSFPTITGYRFIQPIANSPHSSVYLAHSQELGEDVCVKVLRHSDQQGLSPERVARFEREREMLTRIRHRSIVDIYDWGQINDTHYFVTEYFPAGSLELRMRNLMSMQDSIDAFLQIAGALVVIHRGGLCHRDLKPANVMMRADGSLVLIDFGLAITNDGASLTKAGEVHGSPYYISPEQVDGTSGGDHRSDLYSLGIMFFEMLTGTRPFVGKSVFEIIHAHKTQPAPEMTGQLAVFQPMMQKLLAKEPTQRFQNAADALTALSKLKV